MVFIIKSKDKESKIISILLEQLLAHICEKLGKKFESEITNAESGTIAKIKSLSQ